MNNNHVGEAINCREESTRNPFLQLKNVDDTCFQESINKISNLTE